MAWGRLSCVTWVVSVPWACRRGDVSETRPAGALALWELDGRVVQWPRQPVTPRGREAGEIPAQSRYGDRPSEGESPVADHTVHARTFERKVGRTRAPHRLTPLPRPSRREGSRAHARRPL